MKELGRWIDHNGDELGHRVWRLGFEVFTSRHVWILGFQVDRESRALMLYPLPMVGIQVSWLAWEVDE